MSQSDWQVIVQVGFNAIITTNAASLNAGATISSSIVEVDAGSGEGLTSFCYSDVRRLTIALESLTATSRVYLQGHSDWVPTAGGSRRRGCRVAAGFGQDAGRLGRQCVGQRPRARCRGCGDTRCGRSGTGCHFR